jgi:dCMP deaminase
LPTGSQWLAVCRNNAEIMSTCGRKNYYAVILDGTGMVIGTGWNGVPSGLKHCNDGGCPRLNSDSTPGSSYANCYAIHAEANAILHSDWTSRSKVGGSTLYVNGPPCFDCAKLIANSGLTTVVCSYDESYEDWPKVKAFLLSCDIRVIVEGETWNSIR